MKTLLKILLEYRKLNNFRYSALGFGEFCEIHPRQARDSEAQGVTVLRGPSTPLGVSRDTQQASGLLSNARPKVPYWVAVKPLWKISAKALILILILSVGLLSASLDGLLASTVNDELFKKAENEYRRRSYNKAIIIYENLAGEKNFNKRELLLFRLGNCYTILRQNEKAYQILSQLLEEFPQTVYLKTSLNIMIKRLNQSKDYQGAIDLLESYLNKVKNKNEIQKMIIVEYEYKKDYTTALDMLEKDFPTDLWFIQKKTTYLKQLKEYTKAIKFVKANLSKFNTPALYSYLANLYELKKDYDNSILWYEELYKKTKKPTYMINGLRMLVANNKIKKSKPFITKVFNIFGDNIKTYRYIAAIYKEYGIYDELLKLYEKAEQKGYDFKTDRVNIYEILGQYEKAIYNYLKILDDSTYSLVLTKLLNLAEVEEQLDLVEKQLILLENKFTQKKELIFRLQMQIHIKFKKLTRMMEVMTKKYFPLNSINNSFLEGIVNSLFSMENYDYIIDIYKSIPKEINTNINPSIKLRYAQSLYLFKDYERSLTNLNSLKSKTLEPIIKYYKALNYTGLKKYPEALNSLKGQNTYNSFNLHFKILILQKKFKAAEQIVSKGMKNKKFPIHSVAFNDIMMSLFLNEDVIMIEDIKKYLEIYPQSDHANDLVFILFLLQNDFIKNDETIKSKIIDFFKSYYLNDFKQAASYLIKLQFKTNNLDSIIRYYLAKSYVNMDDYDKAIKELKEITNKKTFVKPYALELLGWIYMYKKKNPQAARIYFKKILADYPAFANINNVRKLLTN